MTRSLLLVASLAALATALVSSSSGSARTAASVGTVSVVEHADTDATTDTGAPGDSPGDVLTFANPVFDRQDARQVGTDQGSCVRIVAGASYECAWSLQLAGGQLMVQGPFYDAKDSTLAITGGTGRFRRARGEMLLSAREGGKKYSFVYRVKG